jgi:type I restriction enzyme M protein
MVELGEVCEIKSGGTPSRSESAFWNGTIPWVGSTVCKNGYVMQAEEFITEEGFKNSSTKLFVSGTTLIALVGATIGKTGLLKFDSTTNQNVAGLYPTSLNELDPNYLFYISQCLYPKFLTLGEGKFRMANLSFVRSQKIPLPPIAIQQEIVAEIESYQKVIDGARAVIDNYRPHIPIDPDWAIINLGEICSFKNGLNFTKAESGYTVKIIGVADFQSNLYAPLDDLNTIHLDQPLAEDYLVKTGDILFVRSNGNVDLVGRSIIVPPPQEPTTFSGFTIRGRIEDDRALPIFFAHFFKSRDFADMIKTVGRGANIRNLSQGILNELKIPLPPLETQKAIVAEIEAEQSLVNANRELITRFEKKIQTTLNRIWGEEQKPSLEPDTNLQLTLL